MPEGECGCTEGVWGVNIRIENVAFFGNSRLLSGFDLKQNGTTPNRAINKIAAMSAPARYVLTMFFVSADYRARAAGASFLC